MILSMGDLLQSTAQQLKHLWPDRPVFANEIPTDADGCFFIAVTEAQQSKGLNRQQYRAVGIQILYIRQDRDPMAYLNWADTMFDHFRYLDVDSLRISARNQTAQRDDEGRFYQFRFDVRLTYIEPINAGELMESLAQKEWTQ